MKPVEASLSAIPSPWISGGGDQANGLMSQTPVRRLPPDGTSLGRGRTQETELEASP